MHHSELALDPIQLFRNIYWCEAGYWKTTESIESISYTHNGHKESREIECDSFWYNHRNPILYHIIKKNNPSWVLDVGGGTGFVANFLSQKEIIVCLLEPSISGITIAKNRGLKYCIHGSLKSVNSKKNSVPCITLFDVLEHIDKEEELLHQCNFALQNNGLLFITVPAYNHLWSSFDAEVGHFRRYTISSLKKRLAETNFEIMTSSYFFTILYPLVLLRRKLLQVPRNRNNHILTNNFLSKLIMATLNLEYSLIKRGVRLPFGTSLFVTARKKSIS